MFNSGTQYYSVYKTKLPQVLTFLLLIITNTSYGQTNSKNSLFKKQTINELSQQSSAPRESVYQSVSIGSVPIPPNSSMTGNNSVEEQNRIILQQCGMLPGPTKAKQREELEMLKKEWREEERDEKEVMRLALAKPFLSNYQEFLKMDPDRFSITKAIYLCESAWYDNPPAWQEFEKAIKIWTELARQILKREGLDSRNNTAINYAIQKLYRQDNRFINPRTKQSFTVTRLGYDFSDPMGEKSWENMFVTKLMSTGKGQCHSLPLQYLAMAEQLGGKAYLSLSPQHTFIQFFDNKGYRYNFETTNGNLVSEAWMMQSGYINATALKNRTYLDTLSSKQLYAQLLSDLLQNYLNKVGYDETAMGITNKILSIDPLNMTALIIESDFNTSIAMRKLNEAGNPPVNEIPDYPETNKAYKKMLQSYDVLDQTGYQEMPKETYQQWLQTVEQEKKKQEAIQMQRKMNQEINKGKNPNPVNGNKTKK